MKSDQFVAERMVKTVVSVRWRYLRYLQYRTMFSLEQNHLTEYILLILLMVEFAIRMIIDIPLEECQNFLVFTTLLKDQQQLQCVLLSILTHCFIEMM